MGRWQGSALARSVTLINRPRLPTKASLLYIYLSGADDMKSGGIFSKDTVMLKGAETQANIGCPGCRSRWAKI